MRIPRRVPTLPDAWRRPLHDTAGARPQVLAWSPTLSRGGDDGICVALPDALLVGRREVGDDRTLQPPRWERIGWHEIESGGWNAADGQLVWVLTSHRRGSVHLTDPGLLPEVFRDRVAASIVLKQHLPIEGTRNGVTLSARRDLADPTAPLVWHHTPGKGTRMSDPVVSDLTRRALAQLRNEYDFR